MRWTKYALLGCGALLLAAAANAQFQRPWRGGPRAPDVIERVLDHLDRAHSYSHVDRHEQKHFEQARRDLLRFEDNWQRGRFDRDRLDGAIDNLHHLVGSDQVDRRDRMLLSRDMDALRDFRAGGGRSGWRP